MIIERETSHAALHSAGATTVRQLAPNKFEVFPDINERDLPPLELTAAKTRKLAQLKSAADAEVAPILAEYPEVEIKTWDSQEREARAWTADNSATTPTLTGISEVRGKSISHLADKVIKKADHYRNIVSAVAGKRQALADAVGAATTVAEVEQITWES